MPIRHAVPDDAPEIARLIELIWHDDKPSAPHIASAILDTNRATWVQEEGGIVGFVDSFATVAPDGVCRLEIDLLGVHPGYRGRGMAQALVGASIEAGRAMGAQVARALVRSDNAAALNTFLQCGLVADETICELYVSDQRFDERLAAPPGAHLIPVRTLTYRGVWVEGELSPEALRCARSVRTRYRWDAAGVVLPAGTLATDKQGYELVGQYRWLRFEY